METTQVKHTPGPWEMQPDQRHHEDEMPITAHGPGGPVVCTVWPMGEDFDEPEDDSTWQPVNMLANARLLAAAPDLLAALEFIVNDVPEPGEDAQLTTDGYNRACAAILKARGETL